jgi:hypothetical protein
MRSVTVPKVRRQEMAKRIPLKDRPALIRSPDSWARDWGWVSRRRAVNIAARIEQVAAGIEGALDDEGAQVWVKELRRLSKTIAPAKVPAERKRKVCGDAGTVTSSRLSSQ